MRGALLQRRDDPGPRAEAGGGFLVDHARHLAEFAARSAGRIHRRDAGLSHVSGHGAGSRRPSGRSCSRVSIWPNGAIQAMDASAFAFLRSLLFGELVDDQALTARRARRRQAAAAVHQRRSRQRRGGHRVLSRQHAAGAERGRRQPGRPVADHARVPSCSTSSGRSDWPNSMTATSTHDTKLGEDARMRIATMSVFAARVDRGGAPVEGAQHALRQTTRRGSCPEVRDEYRLYQALVGMWNDDGVEAGPRHAGSRRTAGRRICESRRAKPSSSPAGYGRTPTTKRGSSRSCAACCSRTRPASSGSRLPTFVRLIEPVSNCHSISQLVLKCFMPGVPDFYQGCEDWTIHADRSRQPPSGRLLSRVGTARPHVQSSPRRGEPRPEAADDGHAAAVSRRSRSAVA